MGIVIKLKRQDSDDNEQSEDFSSNLIKQKADRFPFLVRVKGGLVIDSCSVRGTIPPDLCHLW